MGRQFVFQQPVTLQRNPADPRRSSGLVAALLMVPLLAACGFNGTDGERGEEMAEADARPPAPQAQDPDFALWEEVDIADPEPREDMRLQVALDWHGFGPGVIDGAMGLSTRNALKGFQEARGLAVTGEIDEGTRAALASGEQPPATRVVRIPESWGRIA